MEYKHLMYCPFTGLGLYNGFRGNRWLKNRIEVFKQFVVPSLKAQINKNFTLWISWRHEEISNPIVKEFIQWLDIELLITDIHVVHTFSGVCFYDDKYEDMEARDRLINSVHGAIGPLLNVIGEAEYVLVTIQPSDDLYRNVAVEVIQKSFEELPALQAVGFSKGYICNYMTKEIAEYNPNTNPPFYTIKFPREIFVDPKQHVDFTSLKHDVGKYKKGTPLPSHEYVKDCLNYAQIDERGFCVGTHGENISTVFTHPFKGELVDSSVLELFGIKEVPALQIKFSWRKRLLKLLPFKAQRKIRYIFGEKIWQKVYNFLRS